MQNYVWFNFVTCRKTKEKDNNNKKNQLQPKFTQGSR